MNCSISVISLALACAMFSGAGVGQSIDTPRAIENVKDYYGYVNTAALNVRSGPSVRDEIIGEVLIGAALLVTHHHNNWGCVKLPSLGQVAFVHLGYLDNRKRATEPMSTASEYSMMLPSEYDDTLVTNTNVWWVAPVAIAVGLSAAHTAALVILAEGWTRFGGSRLFDLF